MLKQFIIRFILALSLLQTAQASVIVFVHGYLSNGNSWYENGVVYPLMTYPGNIIYTPSIPYWAPILVQTDWLANYMQEIKAQHPKEAIILVGYSSGGVVARSYTVLTQDPQVKALFTITSPHFGTDRAEYTKLLTYSPLGFILPMLGLGSINASQGLFYDLAGYTPSPTLWHLNHSPHPDIFYISFIRNNAIPFGDFIIPQASQNMAFIPGLQKLLPYGKIITIPTPGSHFLIPTDGVIVFSLLWSLGLM